jgi:hypothetical protein
MNISNQTNLVLTTTIRSLKKPYVKNPFDSWYIGGILFMCTIMFVLLYANYYRKNSCQIFCAHIFTKLGILPPLTLSSMSPSSLHHVNDPLLI